MQEINAKYGRPDLVFDPYQMEGLAQSYELHQPVIRFEARGGKSNYQMAENLRSLVANRMIAWYAGAGTLIVDGKKETLVDEMAGLVVRPMSYGYRFDHEAKFHDDRTVAIGMASLHAMQMDQSAPGVPPPPVKPKEKDKEPVFREPMRIKREGIEAFKRRGLWGL